MNKKEVENHRKTKRRFKMSLLSTLTVGAIMVITQMSELYLGDRRLDGHEHEHEDNEDKEEQCHVSPLADPLGKFLGQSPGTVVLYFIGMMYLFFGLGFVCEEYFVLSIEKIIETYNVPPDVAGATLMAAGSSSPELFAELVGVFISEGGNSAGTGTVIGSAVFNQLVIIGGAVMLAPFPQIELDPLPVIRDLFFYAISIILMYVFFKDGKIVAVEAWMLFLAYVAYVFVNAYWSSIVFFVNKKMGAVKEGEAKDDFESNPIDMRHTSPQIGTDNAFGIRSSSSSRMISVDQLKGNIKVQSRYSENGQFSWDLRELKEGFSAGKKGFANPERYSEGRTTTGEPSESTHEEEDHEVGVAGKVIHALTHPLIWFLSWFLLDCKKHPDKFWFAFFNSICWLGLLVFFIIQWVEKSGCLIGFSPALMGLTVGAAGTSSPDALVSFHVARNGLGDMAVR